MALGVCAALIVHGSVARAAEPGSLCVRLSGAMATLTTRDQIGYLRYDEPGFVGTLHFGYALLPWLDARLGTAGGGFLSSAERAGGLIAPNTGLLAHLVDASVLPYVSLDAGAAITGKLLRPFVQLGLGADFPLGAGFALGPQLGHGRVLQTTSNHGSDAGYFFIGLSVAFRSERARRAAVPPTTRPSRIERRVIFESPPTTATEPSPVLLELLDQAVPSARTELLAPVLFAFDSDVLEPIGIAMLHEVRSTLQTRTDLQLVEIVGYADARGGSDYNRDLSERRAQRVMAWLVEHGIDAQRLRAAAQGASGFVEDGGHEAAHTQNRRVVFRVVREEER